MTRRNCGAGSSFPEGFHAPPDHGAGKAPGVDAEAGITRAFSANRDPANREPAIFDIIPSPMHDLITGGAGFLGKALAARLLQRGHLIGADGRDERIDRITLTDVVAAEASTTRASRRSAGDVADRALLGQIVTTRTTGDLSPRGGRQRPGRSGLRSRDAGEPRRDARAARGLPCRGSPSARGVCQLRRGLRRRAARGGARIHAAHAADVVRHAEGHRRAAGRRLHAKGLHRRPGAAASRPSPCGPGSPTPPHRRSPAASSGSR